MTLPRRVSLRDAVPILPVNSKIMRTSYRLPTGDAVAAREALVRRIRRECEEMAGMSLTLIQATRLFGIPSDGCSRILCDESASPRG
jgi:hypothetical protein